MPAPKRMVSGAVDLSGLADKKPEGAPEAQDGIKQVDAASVEQDVLVASSRRPVIVVVGTTRAPECQQLAQDLAELAAGMTVRYVDADTSPELVQAFGISGLPSVIVFAQGRPVTTFEGAQPREALAQWVAALRQSLGLPEDAGEGQDPQPQRDPRFEEAEEAIEQGDFDGAIGIYDALLKEDSGNAEATQARANARLLKRLGAQANAQADAQASADEQAGGVEKQLAGADALMVAGKPEEAFDRLIELLRGPDKDTARTRLLELFELFAPGDPRVQAARSKMANALF